MNKIDVRKIEELEPEKQVRKCIIYLLYVMGTEPRRVSECFYTKLLVVSANDFYTVNRKKVAVHLTS